MNACITYHINQSPINLCHSVLESSNNSNLFLSIEN